MRYFIDQSTLLVYISIYRKKGRARNICLPVRGGGIMEQWLSFLQRKFQHLDRSSQEMTYQSYGISSTVTFTSYSKIMN